MLALSPAPALWYPLVYGSPTGHAFPLQLLAERAAWDFVAAEGRGMELATIQPTAVFGPVRSVPQACLVWTRILLLHVGVLEVA